MDSTGACRKRSAGPTVISNTPLQIRNLGEGGVLATRAQQVTQGAAVDTAVAALVKELEGFAVVGRGLVHVIHGCRVDGSSLQVRRCPSARAVVAMRVVWQSRRCLARMHGDTRARRKAYAAGRSSRPFRRRAGRNEPGRPIAAEGGAERGGRTHHGIAGQDDGVQGEAMLYRLVCVRLWETGVGLRCGGRGGDWLHVLCIDIHRRRHMR